MARSAPLQERVRGVTASSAMKVSRGTRRGMSQAYMVTFYAALVALLMGFWLPGWSSEWTGRGGLHQAGRDESAQYA
jgi:hypothetical protein